MIFESRAGRLAMKDIDFQSMSIDELWALHEAIASILSTRIRAEKLKLEKRLDKLGRKLGNATHETAQRRPYPKVHPKFRNPEPPHETWSGRGKQPRWVIKMFEAGKSVDDLRIPKTAERAARRPPPRPFGTDDLYGVPKTTEQRKPRGA
jgi:DNA-binding protein H-NS